MPEQNSPESEKYVESTAPFTMYPAQDRIVADVRDLFEHRLDTTALHFISSDIGVDRFSALSHELEARFPGEYVFVWGEGHMVPSDLAPYAAGLEKAKVVVLQGPMQSDPAFQDALVELMVSRQTEINTGDENGRKVRRKIVLRDDVVFIVSETGHSGSADRAARWLHQLASTLNVHVSESRLEAEFDSFDGTDNGRDSVATDAPSLN